jgi:UDP-glucose 4-epimerase
MGQYFRIHADNRDLNYNIYVEEGDIKQAQFDDYDSHTVARMNLPEVQELLLSLPEVRSELAAAGISPARAV